MIVGSINVVQSSVNNSHAFLTSTMALFVTTSSENIYEPQEGEDGGSTRLDLDLTGCFLNAGYLFQGSFLYRAFLLGAFFLGAFSQGAFLQGALVALLRGNFLQGEFLQGTLFNVGSSNYFWQKICTLPMFCMSAKL